MKWPWPDGALLILALSLAGWLTLLSCSGSVVSW